jgi:hypothetical protein
MRPLDALADLAGHTVAVILLTEAPDEGAAFMATVKCAARHPVFWVSSGPTRPLNSGSPLAEDDLRVLSPLPP